tara:strand:+ start:125 stop:784 length:660 start_codon:yes stop_codon:yes gene_type:complete
MRLEELKMFEENKYTDIGMNELIVYTANKLCENSRSITREELVLGAFKLFPKKFGLRGHEDWPDSSVIDKRWIDCRHLDYLSGNNKSGLTVLPKGHDLVKITEKKLKVKSISTSNKDNRTRSGKIAEIMENSDGYQKFLNSKNVEEINEFDLREILHCTMESSSEMLNRSFIELEQHLKACNKPVMINFLKEIKKKHISLFLSNNENKYSGGMLKKLNK